MFEPSTVPFDERAVHPFAVVLERRGKILLDGDGLRGHADRIHRFARPLYNSVDCPSTSALHLAINSASGMEP